MDEDRQYLVSGYFYIAIIMKTLSILILELSLTGIIVLAGVSEKGILFINSPRVATITLGIIGFFFCMISVGKFIRTAPAHPLTVIGYILGAIAMFVVIAQIFQWQIPILNQPEAALYVTAICIAIKAVIARFINLIN